eukprot:m.335669 g.335669  ORF g.335669 m.335669 type:complete len:62 (+) comp16076_c0_seq46:3387-3572(+)
MRDEVASSNCLYIQSARQCVCVCLCECKGVSVYVKGVKQYVHSHVLTIESDCLKETQSIHL